MKKKLLCALLATTMVVGMTACGKGGSDSASSMKALNDGLPESYDELSEALYTANLGEFYEAYQEAMAETDADIRFAKEAIAEAKLLESGCILPATSRGGSYAITRMAPNTYASTFWGGDSERFETALVTTDYVTAEDWAAMRELYGELKGTGTYHDAAKKYLTEHGYTLSDTLNYQYSEDNSSWDVFTEWNSTMYDPLCNTFDNLAKYDCENVLQPALAEEIPEPVENADGTVTYTFKIRKGVKWVDSQGREYAEVKADDWVASFQHLLDTGSSIESLFGEAGANIVNADAFMLGEISDFSEVGVKAVDDYTLEYTLAAPCPFFTSMLSYTTFAPLCRQYYESLGGTFAAANGLTSEDYTSGDYGTSQDKILYCGPYLCTKADKDNAISFEANPTYWNAANVEIKHLNWVFDNYSDAQKTYDNFKNGIITNIALITEAVEICKADGDMFDKYVHISATDATSYLIDYNINRAIFNNDGDENALVSPKTDEQKTAATHALRNKHFRLALCYGADRVSMNAQRAGEDLASVRLTNSYTTGTFISLSKEVTVAINGEDVTFPEGTCYGEILQAQITADGFPMQVWNKDANDGLGGSTGYDGWYNPEESAKELEVAIAEIKEDCGFEISAENPVYLDYPVLSTRTDLLNQANAYKQSIEKSTNGCVIVNVVTTEDDNAYYNCSYYVMSGDKENFDVSDMTGWSADFGDPCSYLGTMLPDYSGYFTKQLGIY